MNKNKFLLDIESTRQQARKNLFKGPVTENYKFDLICFLSFPQMREIDGGFAAERSEA